MTGVGEPGDWWFLVMRLTLAAVSGGVIGLNRELHGKPAGLRTHILVSVGSCLFVMTPLLQGGGSDATARVVQGIAAGIGFLGAGEILRAPSKDAPTKERVRGLTSAAAIWVSAALGAVAGSGLWRLTLIGSVVTLLALTVVRWLERAVIRRHRRQRHEAAATPKPPNQAAD